MPPPGRFPRVPIRHRIADDYVAVRRFDPAPVDVASERRKSIRATYDRDGAAHHQASCTHHEQQAEIFDLEEIQDDLGVGHVTDAESETEHDVTDEDHWHEQWIVSLAHGDTPAAWTSTAVPTANPTNVTTFTSEVFEVEPTPQTSCPDVHPFPRRVPIPTKIPQTASRHGWTSVTRMPSWKATA